MSPCFLSRRRVRLSLLSLSLPPSKGGCGAPKDAAFNKCRALCGARAPLGAPPAAISVPGAVLPGADGSLLGPRSGRLTPAFIRTASSHSRQSPIVGPDSFPRPPECGVTSPARRRRTTDDWLPRLSALSVAPSTERLATTPSCEPGKGTISIEIGLGSRGNF